MEAKLHLICSVLISCLLHWINGELGFLVTPTDQAAVYGQELFLHCSVIDKTTGSAPGSLVKLQWLFNGKLCDPKTSVFTNGTLLVPDVTANDMGNYTCTVFDENDVMVLVSSPALVFHAFIKMFEVSPTPVRATEDETVSFDCITGESAPPPIISWERNGQTFRLGSQYSATYGGYSPLVRQYSMRLILKAKPDLDGTYNCMARNPALEIDVRSVRVLLTTAELEAKPYVIDSAVLTKVISPEGVSMVIDCPIRGKPSVTTTWYREGAVIDGNLRFLVLQNGSLHAPNMSRDDAGIYYCEGTNSLGKALSPNITVVVARLHLEFVEVPRDLYVIAGLSATLKCNPPVSVPPATITWYKENKLLVTRTGAQSVRIVKTVDGNWNVVFKEVQKVDEGQYFCVANNEYAVPPSRTSTMATVTVGGAPIFVEPPTGLTIEKGRLAKLTCYVQGDPFPQVNWLFEKDELEVSDTITFREGKQELWIGNIHKGLEGTYTCRAVNRYGTIETRVYVKVLVAPVILSPVGHRSVSLGNSITLPCGIYSDPTPTITWYKDSAALVMGGRFTQLHDGLYISTAMATDAGTYLCEASNIAGKVETVGTLKVQVLPHFTTKPQSQAVVLGKNITLNCSADGFPRPTISWLFNGSTLFPQDTLHSLNRELLFLLEVNWLHVGTYSCIAENREGRSNTSAIITLHVPPKVQQIKGVPLLYKGEDLKLDCVLTGIPAPVVEWQFNREPVQQSINGRITLPDKHSLSVKFVTLEDSGVYTCKGMNPAGVNQRDMQVYIIDRPSAPVLYRAETSSATSVQLSWSLQQKVVQTPVEHVIVFYRKRLESTTDEVQLPPAMVRYEVTGLDPASMYIFHLTAVNKAGTSDISNILAAQTYDAGPSTPRALQMQSVGAYNVTLAWEIPEFTNGQIRKYRLHYIDLDGEEMMVNVASDGRARHELTVSGLKPYMRYSIQVQGATMEGDEVLWGNWSAPINVKTLEAAPSGPPMEVAAEAMINNTVLVSWEAVEQKKQNGPIKRYYVRYWLLSNLTLQLGEKVVESLDLRVNIRDLEPWTWYLFKVVSANNGGIGVSSDGVTFQTLPAAPTGSPINLTAEALSHQSIQVTWQPPSADEWNSDLSGYMIKIWKDGTENMTSVTSHRVTRTLHILSDLDPWTMYHLHIAAFTDQIIEGMGPYSNNVSVKTAQSEPGPVTDLSYIATPTAIRLSWKPPAVTNGIITQYLVTHSLIGAVVVTTPTTEIRPIISNYSGAIYNNTQIMQTVFQGLHKDLTIEDFVIFVGMCDMIVSNQTVSDHFSNINGEGQLEEELQKFNQSQTVINLFTNNRLNITSVCLELRTAILQTIMVTSSEDLSGSAVYNVSVTETEVTVSSLEPQHVYNITVTAATSAGYGPSVTIEAITLQVKPTPLPRTTKRPFVRPTTIPIEQSPLEQKADNSAINLPIILGGGISGFVVVILIVILVMCLFLRRRRANSEEKAQVINQDMSDETFTNRMYGHVDRQSRPPAMASAADDGTDSVDIYGDEVRFYSPHHESSDKSFMTQESGEVYNRRQQAREGFVGVNTIGMDNPSYSGSTLGAVKNNPTFYDETSTSGRESMSVTMAFSSEDVYSQQGDNTLKRKSKMRNVDAAAIARLRNQAAPPGMSENDTSTLISNEAEVVYNERTAL